MFVVFEGIDGSGKTTISNRVVERLRERGLSVKHVRAEGKFASTVTESVRALARDARNLELVPRAEFLLYVAREVQLLEEQLLPALQTHDVVIADRFLYTAEVLARFGRQLDAPFTDAVLRAVAGERTPDLVVLVQVEPALARARRRVQKLLAGDQKPPSRKGLTGSGLAQRLQRGYARLAAAAPERWAVVDNDAELGATVARIVDLIGAAKEKGAWRALVDFRERSATADTVEGPVVGSTADAQRAFLKWVERRAAGEPAVAAYFLGGFFGPAVDELRLTLAERAPVAVLASLRGLTDAVSFDLRERLAVAHPAATASSLAGIPNDDGQALELRRTLAERAGAEVARSLSGAADDAAFELREALYERAPEAVIESLVGLDDARAWRLRERWLSTRRERPSESYPLARSALRSIKGLGDERAWALREALRDAAPADALRSLAGLGDERSQQWRTRALLRAPRPVMESLRGLATAEAWALRLRVAADCREALEGFAGLDVEEAWSLRELYGETWPCAAIRSLGSRAHSSRGQALLARLLPAHGHRLNVQRHAAAIALGVNRDSSLVESD